MASVSEHHSLCYQCNNPVSIETLPNPPHLICRDCNGRFVEFIPATDSPPSLPPSLSSDQEHHFVGIEFDNSDNGEEGNDCVTADESSFNDLSEADRVENREENVARLRAQVCKLRLELELVVREVARSNQNMELPLNSRAESHQLLRLLLEGPSGLKGFPSVAKSELSKLPTVKILSEEEVNVCPICTDMMNVGEASTRLPCGHGYHGYCIAPWLRSRNSCPVCRFELPTDDSKYEKEKNRIYGEASGSG